MKFTSTPPDKPGFYLWKVSATSSVFDVKVLSVDRLGLALDSTLRAAGANHYDFGLKQGGLWCELLPSSEVVTKEQHAKDVKEAFREAYKLAGVGWSGELQHLIENGADHDWLTSTARKRL